MIEITRLSKTGGPLTKRISLNQEGKLVSDGSACVMSRGHAQRVHIDGLSHFADLVQHLEPNEAIALGSLRPDLPDQVEVTTQDRLAKLNGSAPPGLIARNGGHIAYEAGRPALALIDIDTKGMPAEVKARIKGVGGFWAALVSVLSTLAITGRIERRSTSTGISRTDTGEALPGSNGMHVYLHVQDGADVERFLRTLHERCWLSGYGWHMVGAGGQLLDRSLVDRMVFAPERLVFEGAPVLVTPLEQDQASRRARIHDGAALDTKDACPPLRTTETAQLRELKSRSAHALAPARAGERERFIAQRADRLAETAGITSQAARRVIERQCDGILLPDLALPWDAEEFAGCTVADVMADPARFVGATMADPLEGVEYGRTKAMIMRRADGSPWINSFAHGRTVYELRYDAAAIQASIEAAGPEAGAGPFVDMIASADPAEDEEQHLKDLIVKKTGTKLRPLNAMLKAAREDRSKSRAKERSAALGAARTDQRIRLIAPIPSAERLPIVLALDDVLGSLASLEPPMRDADGRPIEARCRTPFVLHAMTESNAEAQP
jgi:hypothetical protein